MANERAIGEDGLPSPWLLRPHIRYVRKLGSGSYGNVYEATAIISEIENYGGLTTTITATVPRRVAVKRISVGKLLYNNPWHLKDKLEIESKIQEEIHLMRRASGTTDAGSYIVRIHDSWEEDDTNDFNKEMGTSNSSFDPENPSDYSGTISEENIVSPFKCFFILMDLCDTDLGSWLQQERFKIDQMIAEKIARQVEKDTLINQLVEELKDPKSRQDRRRLERLHAQTLHQYETVTTTQTTNLNRSQRRAARKGSKINTSFTHPSERQRLWEQNFGVVLFDIYGQLLLCLDFLHVDCGIVHRDLHPGNILISLDRKNNCPVVKLTDLGLSKREQQQQDTEQLSMESLSIIDEKDNNNRELSAPLGCPQYRSPDRKLDCRSDIFSAALVFLKMWFADVCPVVFNDIRREGRFPQWIRESPLFKQFPVQRVHDRMLDPALELRFSAWEAFKHVCTEWHGFLDVRKSAELLASR
jgi:serine/threonine protein kinase